jgi:K+-transporting ATPase KdpF subunit
VQSNILHDFYMPDGKFSPVFRRAPLICEDGLRICRRDYCLLVGDDRVGRRLRRVGEEKVTWAYILSGGVSIALLMYLVVALIRAEDL